MGAAPARLGNRVSWANASISGDRRTPRTAPTSRSSSVLPSLLENGATHLGVATDHVIESFRNDLWPGYKTNAGVPRDLLAQVPMLEDTLFAFGIAVWPMDEYEADDALALAAAAAAAYAGDVI